VLVTGATTNPAGRAFLPGALLALLVTAGALFALAVVIAVNRGGPDRLWLGGGGGAVSLQTRAGTVGGAGDRSALTLPDSPISLLPGARTAGLGLPVSLAARPAATQRRAAAPLRGDTRVRNRADRRPAGSRPARPAPATTSPTAAVPAPASPVVKSRGGGGTSSGDTPVAKRRVAPAKPTPGTAPVATPAPSTSERSAAVTQPYQPAAPQPDGVSQADGTLERVPPGQ
jgi:hypothetical protein